MSIPGSASPLFFQTAAADAAGGGPIKSVRFNQADSAGLYRNFSSAGNRRTWTFSCWIKKSGLYSDNSYQTIFESGVAKGAIQFDSIDQLRVYDGQSGGATVESNSVRMRDLSAWYHVVVKYDTTQSTASDRVVIYLNGVDITSTTATFPGQNYESAFNNTQYHYVGRGTSGNYLHGYLADVYFIDGSALDCTSFGAFDDNGVWQAAAYSGSFGTNGFHLFDFANESGIGNDSSGNDNDFTVNNISEIVPTGNYTVTRAQYTVGVGDQYEPYHAVDGDTYPGTAYADRGYNNNGLSLSGLPQATQSIRINCNIGGGTTTLNANHGSSDVRTFTASATDTGIWKTMSGTVSSSSPYTLTKITGDGGNQTQSYFALYAIEIDGVIIVDSRFGRNNDVLRDVPVNGDASDDTGAGGELSSNYATLNPLAKGTSLTMSNGNLALDQSSAGWDSAYSTIFLPSGKWYAEFTIRERDATNSYGILVGLAAAETNIYNSEISSGDTYAVQNMGSMVKVNHNSGSTNIQNIGHYAVGDVLQLAYDADNGKLWFGRNNTWINSGNPSSGTNATQSSISGTYCFAVALLHTGDKIDCNFGQRAWAYSAPTNFKAVCTSNLPTPTIADGSAHFEPKLFTGNGSTNALTMSNSSMSPDIVWIHERSITGDYELFDSVRGANKVVESNSKNAQSTVANTLTSFDSNGFTLGSSSLVNDNNVTYVGWSWDSGSSNATNYTGSINSTVRANTAAGISIVTYTGTGSAATVGHSLGAVPEFIIIKNLDASKNHIVYHAHMHSSPAEKAMNLNETTEIYDSAGTFNDTAPTSTVFSVGTGAATNASGEGHRALCFAPVFGFSAMGRYDGTGNSDTGAFNYTGMRPAWVMIKRITNQESWVIYDTSRNTNNPTVSRLYSDLSNAESDNTSHFIDILSNGFKVRSGGGLLGASSNEYLWVAFAEHPFQANGGLAR